jgi:uncharacterized protein
MKIEQQFVVARPLPVVWDFFKDIPRVAACMPGAEYLGQKPEGPYLGRVTTKVGPFQTNFEGEADVTFDDAAKQVRSVGKGVDKKGASRGKMTILCSLFDEGGSTKVVVDADVQLSGSIAQFGRTGLLTEIAGVLVANFVHNAEAQLAPTGSAAEAPKAKEAGAAKPISALQLLTAAIRNWFSSLRKKSA